MATQYRSVPAAESDSGVICLQ